MVQLDYGKPVVPGALVLIVPVPREAPEAVAKTWGLYVRIR